jgi:hypothetical protein
MDPELSRTAGGEGHVENPHRFDLTERTAKLGEVVIGFVRQINLTAITEPL